MQGTLNLFRLSSMRRVTLQAQLYKPSISRKKCVKTCFRVASHHSDFANSEPWEHRKVLTLPTILTLGRVVAIPALVYFWFSGDARTCTALFVAAAVTDFLDGYLARKMKTTSAFGAFLDPVADKLMVATVLILLSTQPLPQSGNAWLLPVLTCVVIGREITMSALREWAASLGPEAHSAVAVSWLGKLKTTTQMLAMTALLLAHCGGRMGPLGGQLGIPLLCFAAFLTVWSLIEYLVALWRFF